MLSRFSITTTFAYQNTIYFLRFQTIYYLFLILFYCFCIMFLCFFLSIYFFWLFLSFISFSKNNLYYFAQRKKGSWCHRFSFCNIIPFSVFRCNTYHYMIYYNWFFYISRKQYSWQYYSMILIILLEIFILRRRMLWIFMR